ncbi:MAG TPA: SDR family NAD(P)-dependent oxidoreductase, partial [Myxococcota bacterium]
MSRGLALVTGASSGIGAAYARRLASDGHDLLLVARRRERLETLSRELEKAHPISCRVLCADLATPVGIDAVERQILDGESLGMLVHSAGFNGPRPFVRHDPEWIQAMLQVHVVACARFARAALPGMIAAGRGSLVLISSLGAFFTSSGYVPYSATKAFVNMLAQGLAVDLAGTGVRVQAVCAGLTRTEMLSRPEYDEFNPFQRIPDRFFMSPEQVVEESLRALERGRIIVIPGLRNRVFVRVL